MNDSCSIYEFLNVCYMEKCDGGEKCTRMAERMLSYHVTLCTVSLMLGRVPYILRQKIIALQLHSSPILNEENYFFI